MDNHKMAAWCWADLLDTEEKYTIVHIDKHYDTLDSLLEQWVNPIKDGLKCLTYNEYDTIEFQKNKFERYKIFRWDNYISIFHYFYSKQISQYIFYTHNFGDIPDYLKKQITHCPSHNLMNNFYESFSEYENKLIINLDIDYFFCENPKYFILFSDYAIKKLIKDIMKLVNDKKNILTISLSPECCGGWDNSLNFIKKYFSEYNIEID